MNFLEKLAIASEKNNSLLCVGLDPFQIVVEPEGVFLTNRNIIDATFDIACAYKPNLAIYEGMGQKGLEVLRRTLDYLKEKCPDIPIIGDGKRGDIDNCSRAYKTMLFDYYEFDAVTVNPYMGFDSIEPFIGDKNRFIFILCRTSNKSGKDIQELLVLKEGEPARPLYEVVAELASSSKWNINNNVGLVVGATYPEQIGRIRQICPNSLFLIPGVGHQGGDIQKTVANAVDSSCSGFIINVSRKIMDAASTPTFKFSKSSTAVRNMRIVANQIRNEINSYLPKNISEKRSKDFKPVAI